MYGLYVPLPAKVQSFFRILKVTTMYCSRIINPNFRNYFGSFSRRLQLCPAGNLTQSWIVDHHTVSHAVGLSIRESVSQSDSPSVTVSQSVSHSVSLTDSRMQGVAFITVLSLYPLPVVADNSSRSRLIVFIRIA